MAEHRKKGIWFFVAGGLMLAAALALVLYNRWDSSRAQKAAANTVEQLEQEIPDDKQEGVEDPDTTLKTTNVDGIDYIGVLDIPSLNLSLPVASSFSYSKLRVSPCLYAGSCYSNDMVIAGHDYASHFGSLKWAEEGADVYFTTVDGKVFHYTVDSKEIMKPTQVQEMISGNWDLTLFTCTISGRERMALRCVKAE
ncbi:MAG: sortase [Lactimicrobium massiliense]|nr:sortase [Lactimicrobium massiliense]MDD6674486.1 sortase [Lactimicrobium massiliense]